MRTDNFLRNCYKGKQGNGAEGSKQRISDRSRLHANGNNSCASEGCRCWWNQWKPLFDCFNTELIVFIKVGNEETKSSKAWLNYRLQAKA